MQYGKRGSGVRKPIRSNTKPIKGSAKKPLNNKPRKSQGFSGQSKSNDSTQRTMTDKEKFRRSMITGRR